MKQLVRRLAHKAKRCAQAAAVFGIAVVLAWSSVGPHLVSRDDFTIPAGSVTITDRHGEPLRHVRHNDIHRRWVSIDGVSQNFLLAMIVAEDKRFFEHNGVDLRALTRAIGYAVSPTRRRSGASTITQQTVKLTFGRPLGRWSKPLEVLRALSLEQHMSKSEILEQYVNRLPYADNVVGIARASESYFGKPPSQLTLAEAALLAGLPQAPTRYDPRRHPEAARDRRSVVLRRMQRLGVITAEELRDALNTPIRVQHESRPWRAARFADRVLGAYRHGEVRADSRRRVRSTLDLRVQAETESILRAAVERQRTRGVTNGAAIVVDNKTGEIRAYVGAARPEGPGGSMDLLQAGRQPGSTLKPFVYELFFERGGTAASVLADVAAPMRGGQGETFEAHDYDGRERGPVRARAALSASLNLAAIDAARQVGAERIVSRLRDLGMRNVGSAQEYGAAIALGGLDVRPIDLARAYVTLAREGSRIGLRFTPAATAVQGREVLDPNAARLTTDILRDPVARRDGFGRDLTDLADGDFALKTGTSSGFRDAWAAVYTDELTVVVWLGDPEGRPLDEVSGFGAAAPIAARILGAARTEPEFARGAFVTQMVCPLSGARPGPSCPHAIAERFVEGTGPAHVCPFHQPDGSVVLPPSYAGWQARVQTAGTRIAQLGQRGHLRVVRPRDGARLLIDSTRPPSVDLQATLGGSFATDVVWSVNGHITHGAWRPEPGTHRIEARFGNQVAHAEVSVQRISPPQTP